MARTAEQIRDAILAGIALDPILSVELTSASTTAFFRLLAGIFGEQVHAIELTYETFASDLETALLNQRVGSVPFYREKSLAFQYGDTIIYSGNGQFGYATEDASLQIIKRVAVVVSGQIILLKVAKLVAGVVTPLSTAEMTAFQDYWTEIDFVPSFLQFLSDTADDIRFTFTATLDPQIFDTTTGELLIGGDKAVETAIEDFVDTFSDEDFDGTFYLNKMISEIEQLNGVINFTISVAEAKPDGLGSWTDIIGASGKKYNSYAGYFKTPVLTPTYN